MTESIGTPPEAQAKATLPEDIGMYLDTIRKQYPAIEEVFVMDRDGDDRSAPWGLLAFGDASVLTGIRGDPDLRRDDVELLIVTDGDRFESVWGNKPPGSLGGMNWRLAEADTATYSEAGRAASASRVR